MNSEVFRNVANSSLYWIKTEETVLFNCAEGEKKNEKQFCIHINYVYKFCGIFSESKSMNANLEGLTDKHNVKCYVQDFTESKPRTTPSPVRGIEMFGITEECPFAPQHNTFEEKQFIFCRIKESVMPSWNALLWKRPKSSSNCNGLERPSPPGQQFTFQPGYLWDKAVATNHPLNAQAANLGAIAEVQTHTDTWQTSLMHYFSRRAQHWGSAQMI